MKIHSSSCSARSRRKPRFVWGCLVAAFFIFVLFPTGTWAGPNTTLVSDVVYRADGLPAGGTLLLSWPAFNTSDGKPVAAGNMSIGIGASGAVSLSLTPNEGATPAGTYYKVTLKLNDGTTSTEYWTVPLSGPAKITEIRSQVVPQSVAIQTATRQYVDSTMAVKADNSAVVHTSGNESVTGVKSFIASPMVPTPTVSTAVANKSYVDAQIAGIGVGDFVRKSGDAMTGSLTLLGDPTSTNQAANRHYVDTQVAGVTSSLGQKLARQNDTPITMAAMRFATQFANIQAAVTDAATNGTVVIPSDYSATDAFTNPNGVPVMDLRGGAAGFRGVYNVKDFGAVPDDSGDDWTAIQAAINAASAPTNGAYGAVYVPRGLYYVSKPLHVTKGIKFFGAGRGATTISGYSADQGAVMVVSPPTTAGYTGIPTGPALATGAGSSMYLDQTMNYELNLREGGAVELNGRSALTVELFYKPDFSVTSGQFNIISSSGSVTGPDGSSALAIQHTDNNSITGSLCIGGGVRTVVSPANAVAQGSVYHIALSYDGTTLRLFVNGVLKASTGATGTINQKMAEDFVIGPKVMAFMESNFGNYMAKGWLDSIRVSATARYTANFTNPTAKLLNDGNTMSLLNFDNNYDQFTVAQTMYGQQHLFLRRFGGSMGQVGNFQMSDIAFIGTGPEFIYMISSMLDNVQVTASRRGLQFINNCYLNRLNSVRVVGQQLTQFGVGIGPASGVLTFQDLSLSGGHYPLYVDTSSVVINGLWVETNTGSEVAAVFKGDMNTSAVIDQPEISTETNPNSLRNMLQLINMGTVVMSGGTIETANGAPHVYVTGGGSVIHVGGNYSLVGTAPTFIYQIASAPANGIQLLSPVQQHMTLPWADNLNAIQTGKNLGYTLTFMNVGANAPANSTSYFFGGNPIDTNNTTFDLAKVEVPKSGTIKRIFIRQNTPSGNTGTTENVTHKVCVNTGTNCFGTAAFAYNATSTAGSDATLSQAVSAGDYLSIRVDTPAWATKPTNVRWYATVYID
jgi:hypothetical protein